MGSARWLNLGRGARLLLLQHALGELVHVVGSQADAIDEMISMLRSAGVYDTSVRTDVEFGFDPSRGREISWSEVVVVGVLWAVCFTANPGHLLPATPFGYWMRTAPVSSHIASAGLPLLVILLKLTQTNQTSSRSLRTPGENLF